MTRVYLDHNATSPIRPEAAAAVARALALGGNPSSVHGEGRAAQALLESARETIAAACGAPARALFFTSGGAEADNAAIKGAIAAGATRRLLVCAIEHDAVLETARTEAAHELIPARPDGRVDLEWLERRLAAWDEGDGRPFVAVMLANNETGAVQPVAEAARLVRAAGGLLLVDAVQALGKLPVDVRALGAHYLTLSAHKLGGPPGVGAVVLADDAPFLRRLQGGGQESGRRGGTQNLPGAAGFAAAVEAAERDQARWRDIAAMRDRLEQAIRAARADIIICADAAPRLPNTSCFALPRFRAETQVMALDLAGVAVSAGAACSSGKVRASHVLRAMGMDEDLAGSAIRVSFGWNSTDADADRFVDAWVAAAERAAPNARSAA
ncbi:MAG: cysteine desulfurase [Caulobacterales bacterium]|nr:cysteine desulfurase [Caulobacterales bacterium]